MRTNRLLVLIGGLILILGSRLPWMSVPVLFGLEKPAFEGIEMGWEGDGFITGGIGLILLLVGQVIIQPFHCLWTTYPQVLRSSG